MARNIFEDKLAKLKGSPSAFEMFAVKLAEFDKLSEINRAEMASRKEGVACEGLEKAASNKVIAEVCQQVE